MTIDEVYRFINYVANKEQRGNIRPSDFNLLIPNAQIEFISKRLGNVKTLNDRALPQFGYKINRKLIEDLRTLLVQTTQVVNSEGYVLYPSDFFFLDSIYKEDFTEIKLINTDEYPRLKKSQITPITVDYPVAVPYSDRMLIDPLGSEPFNTNSDFDSGLDDWSQINTIQTLFQLPALNLFTDSGISGWNFYFPTSFIPPGYTTIAWATGATPTASFTATRQASTLLTCDYVFDGPVTSIVSRIVYLKVNGGVLRIRLGFLKSDLFVPFASTSPFDSIQGPIPETEEVDVVTFDNIYSFEKFGIYVYNDGSSGGSLNVDFVLQQLSLIYEGGTPQQWIASEYGYIYYLSPTEPSQSYLIYQSIDQEPGDISVEFGIQYQGTVYVDIYELDVNQNAISVTTVQVDCNGDRVNVSQIISISSACDSIGIVTRTADTIGGELRLHKLSFETPAYCQFNYIKNPATPVWGYTTSEDSNEPIYDPTTSVGLSTPPHTHVEICMIALQSIGINLDADKITQYATMKESTIG